MTGPTFRHLEETELNDLADGTVVEPPEEWIAHLRWCPTCRERLERIRALLDRAGSLTPEIDPGSDGWSTLRAQLTTRARAPRPPRSWIPIGLAAAVVLGLVAVALERRARSGGSQVVALDSTPASSEQSKTEQDLLAELELERGLLRPETVDQLEDELRVINAAAAELQSALARDPGNPTLRRLLAASNEQKAALLKQLGNAS